jgi:N-acetyl-gamma-glutamyl-phosphate reductase/acetylglutamate kinase
VEGSFTRNGRILFWYGVNKVEEVEEAVKTFEQNGRIERVYLPVGPRLPNPQSVAVPHPHFRTFGKEGVHHPC